MSFRHNGFLAESIERSIREVLSNEELEHFAKMPSEDEEPPPGEKTSYLDFDASAPVKPIGSSWETFEDPERFVRTYEFDSSEELADFLTTALEVRQDFNQAVWMSLITQVIPGAFVVEVEVWNGNNPLGEDERLLTQILDEAFDGLYEENNDSGLSIFDEEDYEFY
jgi:hypothetical protein